MHVPHVLPWHGIFPTENPTCAPHKSPFGATKLGLNLEWDDPQLNLLCHNLWGCKAAPNMILVRNYELHFEEKYHVCLFWCFCILDLTQISWPNILYKFSCDTAVGQICGWHKLASLLCHWVISKDLVLALPRALLGNLRSLERLF